MTRYAVVGATGMLGTDVVAALAGRDVTGFGRAELDVTDRAAALERLVDFDVIVNCAAYTKVDDAESNEDAARAINAVGAQNVALAASAAGAVLVHLSTDYVFAGVATSPYPEDAPAAPVSAYGRTKAAGEALVRTANARSVILRTAWLYGSHGPNFATTMLRLASQRDTVSVVNDQRGQPTWTGDLAARIVELLDAGVDAGTFHATNSGEATWFDFARAVFEAAGLDSERVLPTDSGSFVRPAPRPAYSVLGHDGWARVGLAPMRPWREALDAAVAQGLFD
jgi:dTDP-4-dehydrorhamnose reductase